MPLVERRRPALGAEVEPVLRDGERAWRDVVLLNVAASSVDFDSVYWMLAVKPLSSRRRSVNCAALRSDVPFEVR